MIVLDTSVWIEFLKQNQDFTATLQGLLENNKILAVECVFAELLQGAKNARERELLFRYWENLPKTNHHNLWIEAGKFSSENKLFSRGIGLIDCVIIIAARGENAKIWSLDKKLNSLLKGEEKYSLTT